MIKSKNSTLAVLGILLACCVSVEGQNEQYITFSTTNRSTYQNFPVQTNQIFTLVGYNWAGQTPIYGNLANGYQIQINPQLVNNSTSFSGATYLGPSMPQIVTGLTNISIIAGFAPGWATFKITTPCNTTVVSNYVPADSVVIPSSATGNVQIILESSPDLVNWTAAAPGTYSASMATNRFFRVRAAVQ